ncbi:hypothetical protein [Nocardioides sp. YIM 152315]|uniref:hypothetical protein n=1 Tax=Nocardioides sp. YIM 152315 TaxID=3031760 RepID=UPI0023DC60FF|nr:hypothetical protein [Nocardioides sp. YIM 152315]MDF1606547.1 hypothetical protein [Nocardioides sp. YIM 152315]
MIRAVVALLLAVGTTAAPVPATADPIAGTRCSAFPADNWWHADVSDLPVHRRSRQWLLHMSTGVDLHPDFGGRYGIPVTVVKRSHPKVRVRFHYAAESDRVRYPLGRDTRIEGGRGSDGDRHAIVVDSGRCRLYETWNTRTRRGRWVAGSGAVWSLRSNRLRPDGWTSADAAGLPLLPGLLRWREVRAGRVDHAIRFTTDVTSRHHLWPARHDAGSRSSLAYPPMGARFRLRSDFPMRGLSAYAVTVIDAMKTYGLVLADNGSPWYFQGEQNRRWPAALVEELKEIPAADFVAVDTSSLRVSRDSAEVSPD